MNSRREPYIGMPIVLGEYNPMCCNPADRPQRPVPPPNPPQTPPPMPEPPQEPPQTPPPNPPQGPDIEPNPQPPQMPPQQPMVLAIAYVPWQKWQQPYDYEKGLETGTIFPDLNLPFLGYQGGMKR